MKHFPFHCPSQAKIILNNPLAQPHSNATSQIISTPRRVLLSKTIAMLSYNFKPLRRQAILMHSMRSVISIMLEKEYWTIKNLQSIGLKRRLSRDNLKQKLH